MTNTGKRGQPARGQAPRKRGARERVAAVRAQQRRAERRRDLITFSAIAAAVVFAAGGVSWYAVSRDGGGELIPPGAGSGAPDVQPAALTVPDTTGISGVTAYDTAGWPAAISNGPPNRALRHTHVTGPAAYSVTPPVGGDHNADWMNCGVYDKPVPNERAVHNLEHGAIWITYQPSLPKAELNELYSFFSRQTVLDPQGAGSSRYIDITPYPGLPSPVVVTAWGFQLRLSSPADPRLQQFVSTFRASPKYTPEYGGPCTGGLGTPLQT